MAFRHGVGTSEVGECPIITEKRGSVRGTGRSHTSPIFPLRSKGDSFEAMPVGGEPFVIQWRTASITQ
jgi:hypothetical protein